METKVLEIKAALTAVISAVGLFLGWRGILAVVWVCMMIADVASGIAAAKARNEWDSAICRQGAWHKMGMIFVVAVAAATDLVVYVASVSMPDFGMVWPGALLPFALVWYIFTEFGSILENAIKMGAPVPDWLAKGLKISLKALNKMAAERIPGVDVEKAQEAPTDADSD